MKTCDICQVPLGMLKKFRYAEGFICKDCYEKASNHFTETITKKSLEEVKALCEKKSADTPDDFEVTGRVGSFLLFDEKHKKICFPNNRMGQKDISQPEFYSLEEVEKVTMEYQPFMSIEELEEKIKKKDTGTIKFLKVMFQFKGTKSTKEILFLSNPVRIKSYAFKQSFTFAKRILEEMNRVKEEGVQA